MKRYAPWRTRSTGAVLALALSKAHGWSTALISTRAVAYRYYSSAGSWGSDKVIKSYDLHVRTRTRIFFTV